MTRNVLVLLVVVFSIVSCSDETSLPSFFRGSEMELMEVKDLYGLWNVDLDNDPKMNVARMGLAFSENNVVIDYDIYHPDLDSVLEKTLQTNSWSIERDYQGFAKFGATGDAIRVAIGDSIRYWMIKKVGRDSINCFTYAFDMNIPINITLYRSESKVDVAPPFEKKDIIKTGVKEYFESLTKEKNDSVSNNDNSNWMYEKVKRDVKVCKIAIPGTHDSGTSGIAKFTAFAAKTQLYNLDDQWRMGVRSFDLRVRNNSDGEPYINHNFIPCDLSYKKAITTLLRRAATSKECCFLFINTEDNNLGGQKWLKPIITLFLVGKIPLDLEPLHEMETRQKICSVTQEAEAQIMKEYGLEDNIVIAYRPGLTMQEAEGKIILINRLPNDQYKEHYPFLGSAVVGSFSGLKDIVNLNKFRGSTPSSLDTTVYEKCMMVSDLYSNDEGEKAQDFNRRKMDAMEKLAVDGFNQRTQNRSTDEPDILYFNSASASIGDMLLMFQTPIPDYISVAEEVNPTMADYFRLRRTCGIIPMDFAGSHKYSRLTLGEVAAVVLLVGPDPMALGILALIDGKKKKHDVCGDNLLDSILQLSNSVKLEKVSINPNIILNAKPNEQYHITPVFYPADADDHEIKSWKSSCEKVASVVRDTDHGFLKVKSIGNTRVSFETKQGSRFGIYVVAPDPYSKMTAVDLGVSVLWADRNIGAAAPEWDGFYYSWGDSDETLHCYSPSGYKYGSSFENYTKYGPHSLTFRTSLENIDDAAYQYLGNGWRMPTKAEVDELMDIMKDVTWESDELNGVKGYMVSGEGNSIFLPATGYMIGYDIHHDTPDEGYFWTRDLYKTTEWKWESAYCMYVRNTGDKQKNNYGVVNNLRHYGLPIRPVKAK